MTKLADKDPYLCHVNVYHLDVAFFWSMKHYRKYYAKHFDIDVTEHGASCPACASHYELDAGNVFAICMTEDAGWETYAHECSHMVDFISDVIGMPMTMDTTEPRAYLMGYLFRELSLNSPHLAKK